MDLNTILQKNSKSIIQPKLTINSPGDVHEQEADAMANKVLRMPKVDNQSSTSQIMRKETDAHGGIQVSNSFANNLNITKGMGTTLPAATKSTMETAFSTDFSNVKIHNDAKAKDMSQSINAKAFTHGNDIYFGAGQYAPNTPTGKSLLAHELTHTLQQTGNIQRAPMPDETKVADLESYSAKTRQNITFDDSYDFQRKISQYFQAGIVMDVKDGYNISFILKGFAPSETWLETGLKAIALYNFNLDKGSTVEPITNVTTVQNLDLTSQKNPADTTISGPNATVRFTTTKFDSTGKGKKKIENVQFLIEKLGNVTTPIVSKETAAERKKRFETNYGITNAVPVKNDPLGDPPEAISDDKFDIILQALDTVPVGVLAQAKDIPIHRSLASLGPDGEMGEYSQTKAAGTDKWERKITVFNKFFSESFKNQSFLMAHELAHGLDFRPTESPKGKKLSAETGKGSFQEALKKDGGLAKGLSGYAETKKTAKEYFAEAYAIYLTQPNTLKALRPNIYAYFLAKYP